MERRSWGFERSTKRCKRGKSAIFVCDRRTLIEQTSAVADSYGLTAHSVLMADHWRYDKHSPFQIASAQTLAKRRWPDADLIVIDEAHVQMGLGESREGHEGTRDRPVCYAVLRWAWADFFQSGLRFEHA